jgi:hypothetical protein
MGAAMPGRRGVPQAIGFCLIASQSWEPISELCPSIPSIPNIPDGANHPAAFPQPPSVPVFLRHSTLARSIHSLNGIIPLSEPSLSLGTAEHCSSGDVVAFFGGRRTSICWLLAGLEGHWTSSRGFVMRLDVPSDPFVLVGRLLDLLEVAGVTEVTGRDTSRPDREWSAMDRARFDLESRLMVEGDLSDRVQTVEGLGLPAELICVVGLCENFTDFGAPTLVRDFMAEVSRVFGGLVDGAGVRATKFRTAP